MSQDQKPARVRVVKGGSGGNAATVGIAAGEVVEAVAGKSGALPAGKGRGGLLPVALFFSGCIGGGVAVARLMP